MRRGGEIEREGEIEKEGEGGRECVMSHPPPVGLVGRTSSLSSIWQPRTQTRP